MGNFLRALEAASLMGKSLSFNKLDMNEIAIESPILDSALIASIRVNKFLLSNRLINSLIFLVIHIPRTFIKDSPSFFKFLFINIINQNIFTIFIDNFIRTP